MVNGEVFYWTPGSDMTCEKYLKDHFTYREGFHNADGNAFFNISHVVSVTVIQEKKNNE